MERKRWYRITRTVGGIRPGYDIKAASEDDAVDQLERWLGGRLDRRDLDIEETDIEAMRQEMIDAGYVPHF